MGKRKPVKLSYYMRGLGTGIVVTALIMGIATRNSNRPALTDAEIKAAAEKLGMVESSSLKLSDLPSTSDSRNPGEDGKLTDLGSPEGGETPDSGDIGGESADPGSPEGGETPDPGDIDGESADSGSPEGGEISDPGYVGDESADPEGSSADGETITITVSRGTGSRAVCNRLKELGLIEDARGFDQYLIDNGYSKRISVGTYEIETGADWETIAKIITKSR